MPKLLVTLHLGTEEEAEDLESLGHFVRKTFSTGCPRLLVEVSFPLTQNLSADRDFGSKVYELYQGAQKSLRENPYAKYCLNVLLCSLDEAQGAPELPYVAICVVVQRGRLVRYFLGVGEKEDELSSFSAGENKGLKQQAEKALESVPKGTKSAEDKRLGDKIRDSFLVAFDDWHNSAIPPQKLN